MQGNQKTKLPGGDCITIGVQTESNSGGNNQERCIGELNQKPGHEGLEHRTALNLENKGTHNNMERTGQTGRNNYDPSFYA